MKQRANARSRASRPSTTGIGSSGQSPSVEGIGRESSAERRRRRSPRKRKRRHSNYNDDDEDEPFAVLFVKVGICVFFSGLVLWHGIAKHLLIGSFGGGANNAGDDATYEYADDDGGIGGAGAAAGLGVRGAGGVTPPTDRPTTPPTPRPTLPPFPVFDIEEGSVNDNIGLAALLDQIGKRGSAHTDSSSIQSRVRARASDLRKEFINRYGGYNAARYILQASTSTFQPAMHKLEGNIDGSIQVPLAVRHLAERMVACKTSKRPFKMAFGGYSVTAGRGNRFDQSYPFVIQRLLEGAIKDLGIPALEVRNAALGGAPSFPYGWCLENFLGEDPDVVSWGFAMNEANVGGGIVEGLEGYLRRAVVMKTSPMLLVEDAHTALPRRQMLQYYADHGVGLDTLVVHSKPASEPFVTLHDGIKPGGFVDWRKFGAPPGAPGQAPHHPAVKEHEFIGWIVALHFLSAIELASICLEENATLCQTGSPTNHNKDLPPPTFSLQNATQMSPKLYSLLYGSPKASNEASSKWSMNKASCYTTFQPSLTGNLEDFVVKGVAKNAQNLDIMLPKGSQFYNEGWVLDLGDSEKKAKRKLARYGGLGFVDSKPALYGVNASGALELLIPLDEASTRIDLVVVCEVNERRGENECNMERDLAFAVGGIPVKPKLMSFGSASYLGKPICCELPIPPDITGSVAAALGEEKNRLGISLKISVQSTKVTTKDGACSVSHVVVGSRST